MKVSQYNYYLPKALIAQEPAVPRDFSRLLIYDTAKDKIYFDKFLNLGQYLPNNSFLVLNNTKVIPSRITLYKRPSYAKATEGLGRVVVLFLVNEYFSPRGSGKLQGENIIKAMVDRKVKVGEKLYFDSHHYVTVTRQEGKIFFMRLGFSDEIFLKILEEKGRMPIPLYIKNTPLSEKDLRQKYQTVFSQQIASSAAPTASLHFTPRLFKKLGQIGIKRAYVTLNVGMGTFAPVTDENITTARLHAEYYEISKTAADNINQWKKEGRKLVAVGTTVVRALESFQRTSLVAQSSLPPLLKTSLFIYPPFDFRTTDILITNFHLPQSSLMMLVDAFLKFKKAKRGLIDLYQIAIRENFRFYSFGDAALIL